MIDINEIKKLSVEERIKLAEAIWDSIDEDSGDWDLTEEQKRELDRRLDLIESGQAKMYTWEEVKQHLNLNK